MRTSICVEETFLYANNSVPFIHLRYLPTLLLPARQFAGAVPSSGASSPSQGYARPPRPTVHSRIFCSHPNAGRWLRYCVFNVSHRHLHTTEPSCGVRVSLDETSVRRSRTLCGTELFSSEVLDADAE